MENKYQFIPTGTPPPASSSKSRSKKRRVVLDVVDGKTTCPDCGRTVRVTTKNVRMFPHTPPSGAQLCSQSVPHKFKIISTQVGQERADLTAEQLGSRGKKSDNKSRPYLIDHDLDREYPVTGSKSVHAMPVGLPSAGKNRKH